MYWGDSGKQPVIIRNAPVFSFSFLSFSVVYSSVFFFFPPVSPWLCSDCPFIIFRLLCRRLLFSTFSLVLLLRPLSAFLVFFVRLFSSCFRLSFTFSLYPFFLFRFFFFPRVLFSRFSLIGFLPFFFRFCIYVVVPFHFRLIHFVFVKFVISLFSIFSLVRRRSVWCCSLHVPFFPFDKFILFRFILLFFSVFRFTPSFFLFLYFPFSSFAIFFAYVSVYSFPFSLLPFLFFSVFILRVFIFVFLIPSSRFRFYFFLPSSAFIFTCSFSCFFFSPLFSFFAVFFVRPAIYVFYSVVFLSSHCFSVGPAKMRIKNECNATFVWFCRFSATSRRCFVFLIEKSRYRISVLENGKNGWLRVLWQNLRWRGQRPMFWHRLKIAVFKKRKHCQKEAKHSKTRKKEHLKPRKTNGFVNQRE